MLVAALTGSLLAPQFSFQDGQATLRRAQMAALLKGTRPNLVNITSPRASLDHEPALHRMGSMKAYRHLIE